MLRQRGALVKTLDLAVECRDEEVFGGADLIAFYVPMHTATRLAARMIPEVRGLNPSATYRRLRALCADERSLLATPRRPDRIGR